MPTTIKQDPSRHFLVELSRPSEGWLLVAEVTARARSAAAVVAQQGADVTVVRSVYAPESDQLFLIYRSASHETVMSALRGAELSPTQVSDAVAAAGGGRR